MPSSAARFCKLSHLGFVKAEGPDAEAFLHAQLSQHISGLTPDRAPLAGWHDPRGRVRALMRVLRSDDGWLLITPHARGLLDGLKLYLLRAEATLSLPEPDSLGAAAMMGALEDWLTARGIGLGRTPGAAARADGCHWLRIGPELTHVVGPPAALEALAADFEPGSEALAELAEIRQGVPAVTADIDGRYVAQMLNLDTLGAIAFDKGCFPGQEVIARTHNLGSVKRRLRRFSAEVATLPPAGAAVIDANGEPAGEIVRSAAWEGRTELLAVVRLDALDTGLRLDDTPLHPEPLPGV